MTSLNLFLEHYHAVASGSGRSGADGGGRNANLLWITLDCHELAQAPIGCICSPAEVLRWLVLGFRG